MTVDQRSVRRASKVLAAVLAMCGVLMLLGGTAGAVAHPERTAEAEVEVALEQSAHASSVTATRAASHPIVAVAGGPADDTARPPARAVVRCGPEPATGPPQRGPPAPTS